MKTCIMSTAYIDTEPKRVLMEMWLKLNRKLSPECDIIVIDSTSPKKMLPLPVSSFRFDILLNGYHHDEAARSRRKGFEMAIGAGYDWMAYIECDLLFSKSVMPIIDKLERHKIKVAAAFEHQYQFIESQLMFYDLRYLAEIDFIKKWNWNASKVPKFDELRQEEFFSDELFILPLRGMRNDIDFVTPENMRTAFKYGIDFLSHCKDPKCYDKFLEMNGIKL